MNPTTLESLGIEPNSQTKKLRPLGRGLQIFRRSSLIGGKKKTLPSRQVEVIFQGVTADVVLDLDAAHLDIVLVKITSEFSGNPDLVKKAKSLSYKIGAVKYPVGMKIGEVNRT